VTAPLLAAEAARVAIDDATCIDRLDVVVGGPRLLVVGNTSALVAALMGVARTAAQPLAQPLAARIPEPRVVAGSLRLAGADVASREHVEIMGAAPLDPRLPADWTTLDYVTIAMRMGGAPQGKEGVRRATRALDQVGLGTRRLVGSLALPERRALPFAAALARDVQVVVADEPLAGLEGPAAVFVLGAIEAATTGRLAVLGARSPTPGTPEGVLVDHASDLLVLAGGEVAFAGPPSAVPTGARLWGLTVRANATELGAELGRRGIALRGGPLRFSAALPEGTSSREIVAAAVAARAPVVELVPLW
jgi:ABC-2 type transport system ATP-binding protein